ncbi:MAG: oligosaccharide flippase family protein [Aquificaceae bacterium]|nr:oligosaccharide flippase family protein [Aquificaceae bacterium]
MLKFLGSEFKKIYSLLSQVSLLTTAHALIGFLGFLINLLAARELGPEKFGIFSIAYATVTYLASFGELGIGATMIRFYNKYQDDKEMQNRVLGASLLFVSFIALTFVLFSPVLSNLFVEFFGLGSALKSVFMLSIFSGSFFILWMYLQAFLQAHRQFKKLAFFLFTYSFLRCITLAIIYFKLPESIIGWLIASYTLPIFFILFLVIFKSLRILSETFQDFGKTLRTLRDILNYSKWLALSSIAGSGLLYLPRLILAKVSSTEEVGIFSAGVNFAMALTILTSGVGNAIYPQVTAFNKEQIKKYLNLLKKVIIFYILLSIVAIALLGLFLWIALGEKYLRSLPVYFVVSFSLMISLALYFISILIHTFMKPEVIAYTMICGLIAVSILSYILGSLWQALGVGIAYGLVIIGIQIALVYKVFEIYKKGDIIYK